MDLRERQRVATREQIIEAVHQVLVEEHPSSLSMARVAERAGTSLRTLYRYFPTKEALVDAASESFEVNFRSLGMKPRVATAADYLRASWGGFTKSIAAVRAQHLTPAGRALRDSRLPRNRRAVRAALTAEGLSLAKDDTDKLVDLIVALVSSSMYLELVDRLGRPDEQAADLAAWTITAVVDRAKREGTVAP